MRLPWLSPKPTPSRPPDLGERFHRDLMPHADALYGFALKLCKNPSDAEDLVQDTLLKAFGALERTPTDSHYKGWLFTILRNTWLSRMRRTGRVETTAEPPDVAAPEPEPPVTRDVFDDVVAQALERLPEPQRTAVVLCDVEDMPYDVIAKILDCPIGTVRSRIFHARRALREALGPYARSQGVVRNGAATLS